jgi:hypothetical protein
LNVHPNDISDTHALNGGRFVHHYHVKLRWAVDIDDMDMPVSGMIFMAAADMMIGQFVQIEPTSALVPGTPPQLNTNHLRLMKTWMTAKVASKIDANTFTVNSLPGMFGAAGGIEHEDQHFAADRLPKCLWCSGFDAVSIRGPMFVAGGTATMVASKVQKR